MLLIVSVSQEEKLLLRMHPRFALDHQKQMVHTVALPCAGGARAMQARGLWVQMRRARPASLALRI